MSRNNSKRQRVNPQNQQTQNQQPQTPPKAVTNPFTATFVVPTEFVDLPTRGIFYSEDNPLSSLEQIEIKHMTAREEDILGNQDFISRGIVLDKLIESVIIDKNIKVSDLADIDKIAILATARKSGYGDEYKYDLLCRDCDEEVIFTFSMEKLIENATSETRSAPDNLFAEVSNGVFEVGLSECGYTATCRALNDEDYRYISDLEKQRNKHSLDFNNTIELLRRMIISICPSDLPGDTTSDAGTISQFLEFMPAAASRRLKQAHSYMIPTFRMHEELECPSCSSASEREVPFSWAMFWGDA
jgi:hypothetical protein